MNFKTLAFRLICCGSCADRESFVRVGPNFDKFFLIDEGIEDLNVSINWPSCHLAGGPMMAQHHMLAG